MKDNLALCRHAKEFEVLPGRCHRFPLLLVQAALVLRMAEEASAHATIGGLS